MDLSERKRQILKAVIDAYIDRGEPVGSKYLADSLELSLSAATIRGAMNDLEQMGLLEQPYTSAGRVPSTLGYRVYVDQLMESYRLSAAEINQINETLKQRLTGLGEIVERSAQLVSSMTSMMSVSMKPTAALSTVIRFEAIHLDAHNFLLVLVMNANIVKTKHVRIEVPADISLTAKLAIVLNENFSNLTSDNITLPVILKAEAEMGAYSPLIAPMLRIIHETLGEVENAKLYIDGIANLLNYPEYHNIERARSIVALAEQKDELLKLFSAPKSGSLSVYIGNEINITTAGESSVIFKTFSAGPEITGAIGVIGPKRMDYSKIIAKLEYLSKNIEDNLTNR